MGRFDFKRMEMLIICLIFFVSGIASAGSVAFSTIGSTSKSTNTGSGDHWLSASISASNWKFVSRTKSGGNSSSWTSDTNTTKTASFNLIYDPGTFTLNISGRAEPYGGSGGTYTYSDFDVNKNITLNYAISPNPPANVACGENSESLSMKENGTTTVEAYWKAVLSGGTDDYGTSLANNYTFCNESSGAYTISAKRGDAECSTIINNVGVLEIKEKHGSASTYSEVIGTLYVAVGDSLSVKAFPYPSGVEWPPGTPVWSTSGDEWFSSRVSGVGEEKTVDTSAIEDGFTIIAECGISSKSIQVAIIGVDHVTATWNGVTVTSDTDSPEGEETIYVKANEDVTLTAYTDPDEMTWPTDNPEWSGGGLSGSGETKKFNNNPNEYTITVTCGTSVKKIKIIAINIEVTHIALNYNTSSSSSDGLNIKASYSGGDISAPEATPSGGDKKALYIANKDITVKARLTIEPAITINNIKISANVNGWSIGGLSENTVSFSSGISTGDTIGGTSGFVSFSSENPTVSTIKKETAEFEWKLNSIAGQNHTSLTDLNSISGITIYTILGSPLSPWTTTGNTKPWVSALEFAIITCGANNKNEENALSAITNFLYGISYTGNAQCLVFSGGTTYFSYTQYMSTSSANCLDSAMGLTTTAKVVGIDITPRKRTLFFNYNFHCFAKQGSAYVYDSCSAMLYAIIKMAYASYLSAGSPETGSTETTLSYPIQ